MINDLSWIKLENLIEISHGFAFKSEFFSKEPSQVILLTPGNFHIEQRLYFGDNTKYYEGEYSQDYVLNKGDLVVVMTDLTKEMNILGTAVIIDSDKIVLHNQRIGKINIHDHNLLDKQYLLYALNSHTVLKRIKVTASGTTVRHTSPSRIKSNSIPLPPLPEQQKIAQILSTWEEAIAKTDELIAALEQRKKGLMQRLLTGQMRFPGFTDRWIEVSVGEMGEIVSGGTPSTSSPEYWDGNIFWATPSNITSLENRYISRTDRKITQEGLVNSSANLIEPLSLLVCTRATIGELAINKIPISTNQGFKSLVPNADFDVEFLYYLFCHFKHNLIRYAHGSTFLELSKNDFQNMKFSVPRKKEQTKIAKALNLCDDEIELFERNKEQIKMQKKGLMQRLLTGQVRVKVEE